MIYVLPQDRVFSLDSAEEWFQTTLYTYDSFATY